METTILNDIIGKTLVSIEQSGNGAEIDSVLFTDTEGTKYSMYHSQDCCESVSLHDIVGDIDDLIGSPIVQAEGVTHTNETPDDLKDVSAADESWTWTFYKFATNKGSVTLRWLGSSNGYYGEEVNFDTIKKKD